jgi:exopolyphosphatase/pppGpp-phosphohydrolase
VTGLAAEDRADEDAAGRVSAAIDVGSNSVHLLVARVAGTSLEPLADASILLGLGEIVDRLGRLGREARAGCVEALAGYVDLARGLGAERVTLLGTEPFRRAADGAQAQAEVRAATGLPLSVLSHEAEAWLTLLGVLAGAAPGEDTLVLDIGGGSSELVLLAPGQDPVIGIIPAGSARLANGLVGHDPPRDEEIEALRREAALLLSGMPAGRPARGIIVWGSGRNLTLLTGGAHIERDALGLAFARIVAAPALDLVRLYGLRERRARQIAAGVALVEATMTRYGLERLEVSDASLREGAVLAVERAGDAWLERLPEMVTGRA